MTQDDTALVFIAGVQRGGTTTLAAYLHGHPQLVGPRVKETVFFDDERQPWPDVDYSRFTASYDPVALDSGRLQFAVRPITVWWPPSVPRVLAYRPNTKFIVVFRDPIERAWSQWRLETGRGKEELPFAAAIREGRNRMDALPPLHRLRRVYSYVERGFYAAQVRRLLDLVDRGNVLFLRSADLYARPSDVLAALAAFLRIEPFTARDPVWENRSVIGESSVPVADRAFLREIYRDDVAAFTAISGLDVSDWLTVRGDT